MQINRKKAAKQRRIKIIVAIVLLVLVLVIGGYLFIQYQQSSSNQDKNRQPSSSTKEDAANSDNKGAVAPSKGLPKDSTDTTTDQVPTSSDLSVDITSVSQANGQVVAQATTNGDGTCVFLYVPSDGGKPVTRQVATANNACSSSIPENEFTYLGTWKLTITYYNNGNKAEASQDVTIR